MKHNIFFSGNLTTTVQFRLNKPVREALRRSVKCKEKASAFTANCEPAHIRDITLI